MRLPPDQEDFKAKGSTSVFRHLWLLLQLLLAQLRMQCTQSFPPLHMLLLLLSSHLSL